MASRGSAIQSNRVFAVIALLLATLVAAPILAQAGDTAIRLIATVGPGINIIEEQQASSSGSLAFELSRDQGAP